MQQATAISTMENMLMPSGSACSSSALNASNLASTLQPQELSILPHTILPASTLAFKVAPNRLGVRESFRDVKITNVTLVPPLKSFSCLCSFFLKARRLPS
jgi:hypothetical protein